MRETEKRIRLYTERLPRVREKIYASLMLFAVAASMLAVATFSWITLSISPEVTGMPTTVAANGNLEIALASEVYKDADGNVIVVSPDESQVGDSQKDILERNITWGNLINLSDSKYGLEQIVLRPASLNASSLDSNPLMAASYTGDGRVITLDSNFAYAVYNSQTQKFEQSINRGIRAIASVEYEEFEFEDPNMATYLSMLNDAETQIAQARQNFLNMANNMDAVSGLVGTYTNGVLRSNTSAEVCDYNDVVGFYDLMVTVDETVNTPLGKAFMTIFEVYQIQATSLTDSAGNSVYSYTRYADLDAFCSGAVTELGKLNTARVAAGLDAIEFSVLSSYISDRKTLKSDIAKLETIANPGGGVSKSITWGEIQGIVNNIVNISKVTLNGKTMSEWFSSLSNNMSGLLGIINGKASDNNALIKEGMLERLDKTLHNGVNQSFYVKSITIKFDKEALKDRLGNLAVLAGSIGDSISANIRTDAVTEQPESYATLTMQESTVAISAQLTSRDYVAKETYGLSLDFWLRTNKDMSYLILEGDVDTVGEDVFETVSYYPDGAETPSTATDIQIYVADITMETVLVSTVEQYESGSTTNTNRGLEIFKPEGSSVWYYKSNGQPIVETETIEITDEEGTVQATQTITTTMTEPKPKQTERIVGYSGANRIWEEKDLPYDYDPSTSTTQGSGSCYTFYANTPEDQAQSLELISALRVAFVDDQGNLLAEGYFDTERIYSEYGRVTVPLYLDSGATAVETIDGEIRTICSLPKNEAMLISAIIYLDGTKVTNDKVLSAHNIDGTLNIQFGSYTRPEALKDDNLMSEVRVITASLAEDYVFEGTDTEDRTVVVNLAVTGSVPNKIEANFIRVISETQGSAHETFSFTRQADGTWSGSIVMNRPGKFILRTIKVDGVEYRLPQESADLPTIVVPGFAVDSVLSEFGELYTRRTANAAVSENFTIKVYSANKWPSSVKGVFMGEDGSTITTNYSGVSDQWTANVTFNGSDTYTMRYVIIDGEYFELDVPIVRHIYTGLYAKITLGFDPAKFSADEDVRTNEKGITYFFMGGEPHTFDVKVEIFDSAGRPMTDLGSVMLYYTNRQMANLKWNEATSSYDGEHFLIDTPGSYSFDHIGVSGETLDKAISAPMITAATKDPVSYLGIEDAVDDYVVSLSAEDAATITLQFTNAQAAEVYGLFAHTMQSTSVVAIADDSTNVNYRVLKATNNGDGTHTFSLPCEDGYWSLQDVKVAAVFDGDTETFYSGNSANDIWPGAITNLDDEWHAMDEGVDDEGNAYDHYYDIDDLKFKTEQVETKVVGDLHISHNLASYKSLSGAFMQSYPVNFNVTMKDFEDQAISTENMDITFRYIYGTSSTYGSYTYTGSQENQEIAPDAATLQATPTNISGSVTLTGAGRYSVEVTFVADGKAYAVNGTAQPGVGENEVIPAIEVHSTAPTISMAIDPTTTHDTVLNGAAQTLVERTPSIDLTTNTAKVFAVAGSPSRGSGITLKPSSVTLTLSGMGHATGASLAFSGNKMYATSNVQNVTENMSYTWTSEGSVTRYIGQHYSVEKSSSSGCFGTSYETTAYPNEAGTLTANTLVLTYNGVQYSFTIPTITIENYQN